jgi:hypothetical protein
MATIGYCDFGQSLTVPVMDKSPRCTIFSPYTFLEDTDGLPAPTIPVPVKNCESAVLRLFRASKVNYMVFIKASALKESEAIIIPSLHGEGLLPVY